MKTVSKRTEMASIINGHKMPAIVIDLVDTTTYGLKSKKVLIDNGTFANGFPFYIKADVRLYTDEKKFVFTQECSMLKSDFGYSELKEMLDYRNAPIVKADQDVMLVILDSHKRIALNPIILHTSKNIDSNCNIPLTFVDDDYNGSEFLELAGFEIED